MALTTTPGLAGSDSYASVTAADAYHAGLSNTAWTGADAVKEAALRRATAWVDATYKARWPGARLNGRAQALDWPRKDAYDAAGDEVDRDTIPDEVVRATCEAALRELASQGSLSPDVVPGAAVKSETVGPLSVTYAGRTDADAYKPVLTAVDGILSGLIGSKVLWMVRS